MIYLHLSLTDIYDYIDDNKYNEKNFKTLKFPCERDAIISWTLLGRKTFLYIQKDYIEEGLEGAFAYIRHEHSIDS